MKLLQKDLAEKSQDFLTNGVFGMEKNNNVVFLFTINHNIKLQSLLYKRKTYSS